MSGQMLSIADQYRTTKRYRAGMGRNDLQSTVHELSAATRRKEKTPNIAQ